MPPGVLLEPLGSNFGYSLGTFVLLGVTEGVDMDNIVKFVRNGFVVDSTNQQIGASATASTT